MNGDKCFTKGVGIYCKDVYKRQFKGSVGIIVRLHSMGEGATVQSRNVLFIRL